MKGSCKFLLFSFFLLISSSLYSQNEYEGDNEFVGFNSKKEKKYSEGKRKFNIHLSAGYSMSTIFGRDVSDLNDTLRAIKNRQNLDSYQIEPNFSPYGHIDCSFNFSKVISLNIGLKYNNLGWREIAKFTNSNIYYRFKVRYDFHYVSNSIGLQVHPNKFFSVYAGHTFSFLVKNTIYVKEYQTTNGNVVIDEQETLDFAQATNINSAVFLPQFFIGTHFGFDRIRINLNMTYVSKFIRNDIGFNNIALEAGILFKIFNDYDKF